MSEPRLLILCSSFSRLAGLRRALDSALAQTFEDWRLLVLDDQSPDPHIPALVEEYAAKDPRICFHDPGDPYAADERERILTMGRLLNEGLAIAREGGFELVTYLGDGVTYEPDRCARFVEHLAAHEETAVVWGHQVTEEYDEGQLVSVTRRVVGGPYQAFPAGALRMRLSQSNIVDHYSVMERISMTGEIAWTEDPAHWRSLDWARWRELAAAGHRFDFLPHVGEVKRTSRHNLGRLLRAGMSVSKIAALRAKENEEE